MEKDSCFEMATSNIRFGISATREAGMDLADLGCKRILVFTDPNLAKLPPVATVLESLRREKLDHELFDRVRIEPTDTSFREAIEFAASRKCDAFVAVGGGSTIDTAKAASLYSSYPADFLDYVNAPVGKGKPVPGPLRPLIAIPTTSGTGSETTGVAIFDQEKTHVKTGIAHRRLKPALGILDPENTKSMPPLLIACTGLDVLTHSIESYTAMPFDCRPRPERPLLRPAYQGSNPISDIWALEALRMVYTYLPRAVEDRSDSEARGKMLLAAAYAGLGFGNAGVHLCHGMSYPVSGMVRDYNPPGWNADHPLVPHGMAVVLNAPAVFRFTGSACPERHLRCAEVLGAGISKVRPADSGKVLADRIIALMQRLKMPNGLSGVGYTADDIPSLVNGTLPQERVTKLSPRPAGRDELAALFHDALSYW